MTTEPERPTRLFVVDSYDGGDAPFPVLDASSGTRLAWVVRMPTDDLVQALVEGVDETTVTAALTAAGWHVDRVTPASWAHPLAEPADHRTPPQPEGTLS